MTEDQLEKTVKELQKKIADDDKRMVFLRRLIPIDAIHNGYFLDRFVVIKAVKSNQLRS